MGGRIYEGPGNFNTPALVVERDALFIPAGWDSPTKIAILYENIRSVTAPVFRISIFRNCCGSGSTDGGKNQYRHSYVHMSSDTCTQGENVVAVLGSTLFSP